PPILLEFAEKIKTAHGIVLVAPEYNGGYPASLKNAIDVLNDEWKRKPIAISTVSAGPFAGMNMITGLQYVLWKIGALTVPALFPVAMVGNSFDEYGNPSDKAGTDKRAAAFLKELLWLWRQRENDRIMAVKTITIRMRYGKFRIKPLLLAAKII
ncbi:MAG: NAD(P)H-dependent oxidoreductase, partial [Gloeobacteraceae cyanobacterium ES-bin-316]|nr:NAD(P)H-dependent oxidoreductase [Ferruginibacter sp.]